MGVELVGPDGRRLSLRQITAPVVLIHLWASWCPACRGELASLQDATERLGPSGVATVLVSHPQHWSADQAFLRCSGIRLPAYTFAADTPWRMCAAALGVEGGSYAVPRTLVLAGPARRCVLAREGAQDWGSPQIVACLRSWLRAAEARA